MVGRSFHAPRVSLCSLASAQQLQRGPYPRPDRVPDVQAQVPREAAVGREQHTRCRADGLRHGLAMHIQRVHTRGQLQPHEVATLGFGDASALGKETFNQRPSCRVLGLERLAQVAKVTVQPTLHQVLSHGELRRYRRRKRGHHFQALHVPGIAPGGCPAHPVAGCERLGERRAVQHQPLLIEGLGG